MRNSNCLILATLLLLLGCRKSFDIENADKIHKFYVTGPHPDGPSYPVRIIVSGKINGKAIIYITHSEKAYNSSNSMTFGPLDQEKKMYREVASKNNIIIYKPLTAKKGHLNIQVKFTYD